MSRTPILVVAAAIVAAVIWLQQLFGYLVGLDFLYGVPQDGALEVFVSAFPQVMFENLLEGLLFAAGWFLSVRFIAVVRVSDGWKRTILRGVLATVSGAVALAVGLTIIGFLGSLGAGPHPFGYAFNLTITTTTFSHWAYQTAQFAIRPMFDLFPLGILGCVLLKLWLAAHPVTVETKARVSASA